MTPPEPEQRRADTDVARDACEPAPGPGGGRPEDAPRARPELAPPGAPSSPSSRAVPSPLVRLWPWAPVLLHLATVFYLSSQPNPLPELTTRFWDKGLHFVEYGSLGALLLFALRWSGVGRTRALAVAALGASLYGASDELHQSFVPGRSCELLDWAADTSGGAMGAALLALSLRLLKAPASIRRGSGRG